MRWYEGTTLLGSGTLAVTNGADENAVVSAMVVVRDDGNDVLWPAQIA